MRIAFPYPGYEDIRPFEVPDANLMGIWEPRVVPEPDDDQLIKRSLESPNESPRLSELARESRPGAKRVVILIDDGTRRTPIATILTHVLAELHAAGVEDSDITVLTALGTHRAMTEPELQTKMGASYGRLKVVQHEWTNEAVLHDFGTTKDGTRVTAHHALRDAELVIGLGMIVPHRVKGFSGGAKIAFPGVAGREIMERNQWEASMHMSETVMGVAENPMRLRMEEAADLVGLSFIVNVVLDRDGRIAGCFAGDPRAAHRAGCETARAIYAAHLPHRADIAIADAHPADRDFWQSAKAAYSGTLAVKEGGTLIIVAPNPEGVADNHPNLLELGRLPHAQIVEMVHAKKIDDLIGAAILADVAQILDHADCIMVSPGVREADAVKLGFRYARSCREALEMGFDRQGRNAKVAVLRHGGHLLPIAGPRDSTGE